jgi:hypothetical protein
MLARMLHEAHNDRSTFETIICQYTLEQLFETYHNGIISKLLEYFISINDDSRIAFLLETVEPYLMKRDYMHFIKYYYENMSELALDIFKNKVLGKFEILQKDLEYIIEHKFTKLIPLMEGLFIRTSSIEYKIITLEEVEYTFKQNEELKLYTIPNEQIDMILGEVQKESNLKVNVKYKYTAIIDGGSVLHSRGGNVSSNSLNDLITISLVVRSTLGDPLVVIHKRHLKTIPNLEKEMQKNGIAYFLTPYKMNDDLFILNFFLSFGTKPYIITNDMYRDHIFKFEKSKGIKFGLSQFKDVIEQQTISFDITRNWLDFKPDVSMCIQKYDKHYIIPHINGNFILYSC